MDQRENDGIEAALREMDRLYDGQAIMRWHVRLYDPVTGGFYYALSSAESPEFGPHLESTRQVLLAWEKMPEELRRRMGRWVQSTQDPATGFFCEPECGIENASLSKLGRDQGSAAELLKAAGMEPLYKTASQRQAGAASRKPQGGTGSAEEGQPFLRSREAVLQWLDSMDWSTGRGCWTAGNAVNAVAGLIADAGYRGVVLDYILEKQNPETGLWGPDVSYESVGGAAKFSMAGYFDEKCPYPHIDRLLESVLSLMEKGDSVEGAAVMNVPTAVLLALQSYQGKDGGIPDSLRGKIDGLLPHLIRGMSREVLRYRKPDGGFGYQAKGGQSTSQGMRVSLGRNESDVNGTKMMLSTRERVYALAGLQARPLWDEEERIALIVEKASRSL